MNTFAICYDLMSPGQKYAAVDAAIMSRYGTHCKLLNTTWFVATQDSAEDINRYLQSAKDKLGRKVIDANDKLFVTAVSRGWWAYGFAKEQTDWLHNQV